MSWLICIISALNPQQIGRISNMDLIILLIVGLLNLSQSVQDLAARVAALEASKPPRFVIKDAAGVEVGPVVGMDIGSPKTILFHPDGRLFGVNVFRDKLAMRPPAVLFAGIDCSGPAYIRTTPGDIAEGTFLFTYAVMAGPGFTVYKPGGPELIGVPYQSVRSSFQSGFQSGPSVCDNVGPQNASNVFEAEVISEWANLQAPFSVHKQ